MILKYFNMVIFSVAIFCLAACNEVEQKSDDEISANQVEATNLQVKNVIGYWEPLNSDNYAFEFFPSLVEGVNTNQLMTGRLYQNNQVVGMFSWRITENGQINLDLREFSCPNRPLSVCEIKSSMNIEASGNDTGKSFWEVNHDQGNDGEVDVVFDDTYEKKRLDLSMKKLGELYLIPIEEYFETAIVAGEKSNDNIELTLLNLNEAVSVSSSPTNSPTSKLSFNDSAIVSSSRDFDISDVGMQTFTIESHYENIELRASVNNAYAYSYEIHRTVIIPDEIDENLVDFDDFSALDKRTVLVRYIDSFIDAPEIGSGDSFFTHINSLEIQEQFFETNDITFDSLSTGFLTEQNLIQDSLTRQLNFVWEAPSDGSIMLNVADGSSVKIKFIREISGVYSALMITGSSDSTEKQYTVHDFVKNNNFEITDDMFPGRYQVDNLAGYGKTYINFYADGTVNFTNFDFQNLGGYWFVDNQGALINYECIDLLGNEINNYDECLDSFNFVGTSSRYTQFSHIRKLAFSHRNGDDFIVKYDASVWGGVFGSEPDYSSLHFTYRIKRVGDAVKE